MPSTSRSLSKKRATRDRVHGDTARIGQILWNLLKNAVKFTPDGGRIEITTASQADDFLLTMTDSGVGIDPELLPRIFDAFEKGARRAATHAKGTTGGLGLGLTISKALTDLHHGKLTAVSEGPGKGAAFILCLPLMKLVSPPPPVQAPSAPGPKYRILFVEDHADTAMALARVLSRQGYAVNRADSVAAAKKTDRRRALRPADQRHRPPRRQRPGNHEASQSKALHPRHRGERLWNGRRHHLRQIRRFLSASHQTGPSWSAA